MAEVNIYFNDLASEAQEELWRRVQQELLDYGEVEPKDEDESEEWFQQRLGEAVDFYINTHNFAHRFSI